MIKREDIEAYLIGNTNLDLSGIFQWTNIIHDCITGLSQDKWVSIEDNTPPTCDNPYECEELIVFVDGYREYEVIFHENSFKRQVLDHDGDFSHFQEIEGMVTHWMPLPELPNDK